MPPFTTTEPIALPLRRKGERSLSEEEAEWLDYRRTRGKGGQPLEREAVFGLIGFSSTLTVGLFGWVFFKKIWFVWLGMPGWW